LDFLFVGFCKVCGSVGVGFPWDCAPGAVVLGRVLAHYCAVCSFSRGEKGKRNWKDVRYIRPQLNGALCNDEAYIQHHNSGKDKLNHSTIDTRTDPDTRQNAKIKNIQIQCHG